MLLRRIVLLALVILITSPQFLRAEEEKVKVLRGRTYVTRDTGPLAADIYMPTGTGPFPGILVVHGGAWRIGTRMQLSAAAMTFAEHGYTAVAISYRLAPQSTFPAQVYDCQAAVRWMRQNASEFKIDPKHIGGFGYSAGGHLVALLGTLGDDDYKEQGLAAGAPSARLQCVLAGGAPCDFRDMPPNIGMLSYWLAGTRAEKPDNYRDASPANFVTADDPPMYFYNGEDDVLVPISSPRQMVSSLKKAGLTAEMFTVKKAGHLQALFDPAPVQHAVEFADKYLKSQPASRAVPENNASASKLPKVSTDSASNSQETGDGK
jgi:acetyl esterase/lipase